MAQQLTLQEQIELAISFNKTARAHWAQGNKYPEHHPKRLAANREAIATYQKTVALQDKIITQLLKARENDSREITREAATDDRCI